VNSSFYNHLGFRVKVTIRDQRSYDGRIRKTHVTTSLGKTMCRTQISTNLVQGQGYSKRSNVM